MPKYRVAAFCASIVVVIAFIAGCATVNSGREFDATKAQTFQKGKTSKADIIAAMGQPTSTGINPDGSFIEYYRQTLSTNTLVGLGLAQSDVKVKTCRFMFDARDTLRDYACSEGEPSYSTLPK